MKLVLILLIPLIALNGTAQVNEVTQLVGKKVTVGRLPLCQPSTYNVDLSHSGKQATVVSAKPSKFPAVSEKMLNRMPPETRALIEEQRKGATLLLEFEDGTKLDTCAPIGPKQAADNIELLPGQKIESTVLPEQAPSTAASSLAPAVATSVSIPQDCPVEVTKVKSSDGGFGHALADAMTTSEFERQLDTTTHGGKGKHYLDMRMRNVGTKNIRAVESTVIYSNAMGDETSRDTLVTQNNKPIKPGQELKSYFMDRSVQSSNGRGDVVIYIQRVRFEDNTYWQDNGSHSCKLTSEIK